MFQKKPSKLVKITAVLSVCSKSRPSKPIPRQQRSFSVSGCLGWYAIVVSLCLANSAANADLLGVYLMDGDAVDISGNGNNGTVVGSPTTSVAGGSDGAAYMSFNGVDQYIDVPLDINPSKLPQLTIGAWARVPSGTTPAIRQIISHDDGGWDRGIGTDVRGNLDGAGDTTFRWTGFTGNGMFGNTTPIDGTEDFWVFMAAVYDQAADSTTLYVGDDQSFSGQHAFGSGMPALRIGSNPGFGEFWLGDIDNVFLFDEALSPERIGLIRETGLVGIFLPERPCDFNRDGVCDIVDLDGLMYTGIPNNDLTFDIDGNGSVDLDDRDEWLSQIDSFPGDANLDGKVDAGDLNDLGLNWRGNAGSFAGGDFNGDGSVNAADLNTLALSWQEGVAVAAAAEAVPEPSTVLLLILAATAIFARRR